MQNSIYLLSAVTAVCGLWFLWNLGLKPLFLDMFRERIFELRFRLFRLSMTEELSFDNDAYRSVETLMCGLLRFGHRITFSTYILSLVEQSRARKEKDYVDVSQQIALKVSRLEPETQQKVAAIISDARTAVILYVAFTSLVFIVILFVMMVAKWLGIRRPNREALSCPVVQEVYRAELRRPLNPAPAI